MRHFFVAGRVEYVVLLAVNNFVCRAKHLEAELAFHSLIDSSWVATRLFWGAQGVCLGEPAWLHGPYSCWKRGSSVISYHLLIETTCCGSLKLVLAIAVLIQKIFLVTLCVRLVATVKSNVEQDEKQNACQQKVAVDNEYKRCQTFWTDVPSKNRVVIVTLFNLFSVNKCVSVNDPASFE